MPYYTYICECEASTEINHPMDDRPEVICEHCGEVMVKKFGAPVVVFRGRGFYSTEK